MSNDTCICTLFCLHAKKVFAFSYLQILSSKFCFVCKQNFVLLLIRKQLNNIESLHFPLYSYKLQSLHLSKKRNIIIIFNLFEFTTNLLFIECCHS